MDAHHMRAMLRAWTICSKFDTRESKDKADEFIVFIGTGDQSAVVDRSDQHMRRNHIGFTAGPDGALQRLNGIHIFRRLKNFDKWSRHKRCAEQVEGSTRRAN